MITGGWLYFIALWVKYPVDWRDKLEEFGFWELELLRVFLTPMYFFYLFWAVIVTRAASNFRDVPAPAPTLTNVTVPQGVMPGQLLQLQTPSGQVVSVAVPAGMAPGGVFQIQV